MMPMIIELRGFNAVATHFQGAAAALGPVATAIVGLTGSELARLAREIHLPHFLTGATFFSISAGERGSGVVDVHSDGGAIYVDVGTVENPQASPTPQARLIEFGFIHKDTGQFIQYPFMIPAAMAIKPLFEQTMVNAISIVVGAKRTGRSPLSSDALSAELSAARNTLYSSAKFLGDLNVIIGSPFLASVRSFAYMTARGLGDLDAGMRGAIGARITRRVTGRFTGAGISTTRSAILSGPSASHAASSQRIYNRLAGAGIGRGLREAGE
jgi:hypothetical protein